MGIVLRGKKTLFYYWYFVELKSMIILKKYSKCILIVGVYNILQEERVDEINLFTTDKIRYLCV